MHNGIAIALAWPETSCKQAGSWYDIPMKWVGLNVDYSYKIGHSAIVLINKSTGDCSYFDFGRYHSPFQYGRVRSDETDCELEIKSKAEFNEAGSLQNYKEILEELFKNKACHGTGRMCASYCDVVFENAHEQAIIMQQQSPIPYGPFLPYGTNCSRFVNEILLSGKPNLLFQVALKFTKIISPTPIGNVKTLSNYCIMSKELINETIRPLLSS